MQPHFSKQFNNYTQKRKNITPTKKLNTTQKQNNTNNTYTNHTYLTLNSQHTP